MITAADKVELCKKLYIKRKTAQTAALLVFRSVIAFLATGEERFPRLAQKTAAENRSKYPWSFDAYFLHVYALLTGGDIDAAQKMTESIRGYAAEFRKRSPRHYFAYMFFCYKTEPDERKAVRTYNDLLSKFDAERNAEFSDRMMLLPAVCFGGKFLAEYERVAETYPAVFTVSLFAERDKTICPDLFATKALRDGFSFTGVRPSDYIVFSSETLKKIYKSFPRGEILQKICDDLMSKRDFSEEAFYYYRESEFKQMLLPQLYEYVVLSAAENDISDLSLYALSSYLSLRKPDPQKKPFIYHTLLSDDKFVELRKKYLSDIKNFGLLSLEKKQKGRYYNSIYKFLLDCEPTSMPGLIDASAIEKELRTQMFLYEVKTSDEAAKHIFVFEEEKIEKTFYDFVDDVAIVRASSPNFSYCVFGTGKRCIINATVKVTPIVQNTDVSLAMRYIKKGDNDINLLITASRGFMELKNPDADCLDVFSKTLTSTGVSRKFRMAVSVAMGNYYSNVRNLAKAVSYYNSIDAELLSGERAAQAVSVYMNSENFNKAAEIIQKHSGSIPKPALFVALKRLAVITGNEKSIAAAAYEIIMNYKYDKTLVDLVLAHYSGSRQEWINLSNTLERLNMPELALDKLILSSSIYCRIFDESVQEIFSRMYCYDSAMTEIEDFAMYCCYELIANKRKPTYNVLVILEKILASSGTEILIYALAHAYIEHNFVTKISDLVKKEAFDLCEKNKISFPTFKKVKDKNILTPYIEKNQPFIYK
ncbi:MAG: DUF5717 family protein, partial [Clostridiales bacterium]|nr:DUF5717 family protein [Clostridiales bacterium]